MQKHTQGPWNITPEEYDHPSRSAVLDYRYITARCEPTTHGDTETICKLMDSPNISANARLIAAAPELLEACREMAKAIKTADDDDSGANWEEIGAAEDSIRAAIAKATDQN